MRGKTRLRIDVRYGPFFLAFAPSTETRFFIFYVYHRRTFLSAELTNLFGTIATYLQKRVRIKFFGREILILI